jgi:hypothetical protein
VEAYPNNHGGVGTADDRRHHANSSGSGPDAGSIVAAMGRDKAEELPVQKDGLMESTIAVIGPSFRFRIMRFVIEFHLGIGWMTKRVES